MKMIAEDYGLLKGLVLRVIDTNRAEGETPAAFMARYADHMQEKHPAIKDKAMAARWQVFHVAMRLPCMYDGQQFRGPTSSMMGFNGKLYAYLNDDHIDTALRKIVAEVSQ